MKKTIIVFGAVALAMLVVSTATAVPTTSSETVENVLDEQKEFLDKIKANPQTKGPIIDLINTIIKIIQIALTLLNLVKIIQNIITIIQTILDLLNPSTS